MKPDVVLDRSRVILGRGITSWPTAIDHIHLAGLGEAVAVLSRALWGGSPWDTRGGSLPPFPRAGTLRSGLGVGRVGLGAGCGQRGNGNAAIGGCASATVSIEKKLT